MNYEIKNGVAGPIIIFKSGETTNGFYDIPKEILELIKNLQSQIDYFKTSYVALQNGSDEYEDKLIQEIEFLRKRENKLQLIEQMFKSGTIDLKKISDLVKGSGE